MAPDPKGEGDRIARLLDELRGMAGPTTWQRIEELVRRVVGLYGAGLGRMLALAAADSGRLDPALVARLCDDELVSSLLLLHGLHPLPTEERLARAVEALRAQLGADVQLDLLGVGADGVVRLRLAVAPGGCASSGAALARAVEQSLLEAAPEVARVELAGAAIAEPQRERLVTLGRPPGSGEAASP
ncbi:NifU family protein [Anaeromyxobacter oryzae]|uniref:NIF system FeS cluster assembly NifU C-terminal domain-containing protein n=1 Tax=Anaeromyxobacter oryzae TaxID=2918170 RepID=A0ABM7WPH9_9BACT|nr:NifU family protein [Anaeromyxobacter oryzae]BDG01373.1 hypothetical protein AMOR_03690 [Anaeromyxobacter oryzae]